MTSRSVIRLASSIGLLIGLVLLFQLGFDSDRLTSRAAFDSPLPFDSPLAMSGSPLSVGGIFTATVSAQTDTSVVPDEVTVLLFPRGALPETVEVEITKLTELPAALPRNAQCEGYGLDVEVRAQADGSLIDELGRPVTITLRYGSLPGMGNVASQHLLKLYRYDEERGVWQVLPGRVSPATGVLAATTDRFGLLGRFVKLCVKS